MPSQILEGLTALQAESKDITGLVNSISSSRNMGKDKEALKMMAKEAGMPEGYENAINMAKTQDDLGMISGQIMNKNGQMEKYNRIRGASSEFSGPSQTLEDFIRASGRDPSTMSDVDRILIEEQYANKVKGERSSSIINSDKIKSLGEAKSAIELQGLTGGGSNRSLRPKDVLDFKMKGGNLDQRENTQWNRNSSTSINEINKQLKDEGAPQLSALSANITGLAGSLNNIFKDMEVSDGRTMSDVVDESTGPNLLGVWLVGRGLGQNVLGKLGDLGVDSLSAPDNVAKRVNSQFNDYLVNYIKSMSGLAVTDQEREFFKNITGLGGASDKGEVLRTIQDKIQNSIDALTTMRNTVDVYGENRTFATKKGIINATEYLKPKRAVIDKSIEQFKEAQNFFAKVENSRVNAKKILGSGGGNPPTTKPVEQPVSKIVYNIGDIKISSSGAKWKKTNTGWEKVK
jgi:hypothetical protein